MWLCLHQCEHRALECFSQQWLSVCMHISGTESFCWISEDSINLFSPLLLLLTLPLYFVPLFRWKCKRYAVAVMQPHAAVPLPSFFTRCMRMSSFMPIDLNDWPESLALLCTRSQCISANCTIERERGMQQKRGSGAWIFPAVTSASSKYSYF